MALDITDQDHRTRNAELGHTLSYWTAQASTRIIELENRCTGNRTVGSNPTLSAIIALCRPIEGQSSIVHQPVGGELWRMPSV
jgi:hypothetical protein